MILVRAYRRLRMEVRFIGWDLDERFPDQPYASRSTMRRIRLAIAAVCILTPLNYLGIITPI